MFFGLVFSLIAFAISYPFGLMNSYPRIFWAVYTGFMLMLAWQCNGFAEFILSGEVEYTKEMEQWVAYCESLSKGNDKISPPQF